MRDGKLARAFGRRLRRNRGRWRLSLVLARLASLTTRNEALVRRLRSPLNMHLITVGYFTHTCVLTASLSPTKNIGLLVVWLSKENFNKLVFITSTISHRNSVNSCFTYILIRNQLSSAIMQTFSESLEAL